MPSDRKKNSQLSRVGQFLALAVLIHLALIPLMEPLIPEAEPRTSTKALRVTHLTPSQLKAATQKNKRLTEPKKKKEKPEKKVEPEKLPDGQIVDVPPSADDTPPEDAKYLSEYNTRTQRETVSRHRRPDYVNTMNEVSQARKTEEQQAKLQDATALEIGPERPRDKKDASQAADDFAMEMPRLKQRDQLALALDPALGTLQNKAPVEAMKGNSHRLRLSMGESDEKPSEQSTAPKAGPQALKLMPTIGVLANLSGGPSNDHLEDLEEGEGTFLNSREFKYASFFNRMKRGVSQFWRPEREYRRRDPTGNIYGNRSRSTVLSITLHADGKLKDIRVEQSSGVDFLDREAMAAFKRAEPFPNPPKGLVDGDTGDIEFPFGFHLVVHPQTGIRLPF